MYISRSKNIQKVYIVHINKYLIGKIFDFFAYKHVLRPPEAKKLVFKKSIGVYVYVPVYRWYFGGIKN